MNCIFLKLTRLHETTTLNLEIWSRTSVKKRAFCITSASEKQQMIFPFNFLDCKRQKGYDRPHRAMQNKRWIIRHSLTRNSNISTWDTPELTAGKVRFNPRTQEFRRQFPVAPSLTETWALCLLFLSIFYSLLIFSKVT